MKMNRIAMWCLGLVAGAAFAVGIGLPDISWAQESVAIRAMLVKIVPDDPTAAAWSSAVPAKFPLSPQVHWPTRILEVTAQNVTARGLSDGKQVAIMLEYDDPTEDPDDAAAVEFMVGDKRAHFGLGSAKKIKLLEVTWPNGKVQHLESIAADQVLTVHEPTR